MVQLAASHGHGVGGSDIRPGSHGRDVGGQGDEDPGRGGPGPAGGHVHHDGDWRVQHIFDDVPHGKVQPAGGVQLDDQTVRSVLEGFIDAPLDKIGDGRGDGVVDFHEVDVFFLGGEKTGKQRKKKAGEKKPQEKESAEKPLAHYRNSLESAGAEKFKAGRTPS
jgi:hypothetical protein